MKELIVLILFMIIHLASFAQAPNAIPYQGVARDASGNVLINRTIGLRFKVHDTTAAGTVVYSETQTITTNSIGTFTANIGQGTVVSGTFAGINWNTAAKYIQVEMDINGGTAYVDMGTKQMLSVPYALSSPGSNFWVGNSPTLATASTFNKLVLGSQCQVNGDFTTAMGYGTTAFSKASTSMGINSLASGYASLAAGNLTYTNDSNAIALGYKSSATGHSSTALGYKTKAMGDSSFAVGSSATAIGKNAVAMGKKTTASGNNSTAMGEATVAFGYVSTAMGLATQAMADGSTSMGSYSVASGGSSTAMGDNSSATGYASFATGSFTDASNSSSTAMGEFTQAFGYASTAMGQGSLAEGLVSTAMGFSTLASGINSTAMGNITYASGDNSTAMGSESIASGLISTAMGDNTVASGNYSTAMGRMVNTNGYSGTFMIGDADPDNTGVTTGGIANQFVARFYNGYYLLTSNNNNASRCGAYMNHNDNAWRQISDSNRKEKLRPVDGEKLLKKIAGFRLNTWNYKGQDSKTYRHYGPMAQDFFNAFGHDELGTIGDDSSINQADFLGVNFTAIHALEKRTQKIAVLQSELDLMRSELNAGKSELDDLKKQNAALKKEIESIKEMLKSKNQ